MEKTKDDVMNMSIDEFKTENELECKMSQDYSKSKETLTGRD